MHLTNSGKADAILPQYGGDNAPTAWYEHVNGGFVKHVVSPKTYGHGIGAGDVNRVSTFVAEQYLRGALRYKDADIMVEGVNFAVIRTLFPWWKLFADHRPVSRPWIVSGNCCCNWAAKTWAWLAGRWKTW